MYMYDVFNHCPFMPALNSERRLVNTIYGVKMQTNHKLKNDQQKKTDDKTDSKLDEWEYTKHCANETR